MVVLAAHVMRGFLDLPDNRLAVVLERAGDHHEAGEAQVTFQSLTTHLPHLHRDTPVKLSLAPSLLFSSQHKDRKLHFTRTDMGIPAGGSGVPSPCTPAPELELLHGTSLCALCRSWVDTLKTGANRC